MRNSKKLVITTVCKKYGKIACGRSITLATVLFFSFSFFNLPILAIQFFLAISLPKFIFSLPHPSHHFSLLSPTFSQNFGIGVAEIRFSHHFTK